MLFNRKAGILTLFVFRKAFLYKSFQFLKLRKKYCSYRQRVFSISKNIGKRGNYIQNIYMHRYIWPITLPAIFDQSHYRQNCLSLWLLRVRKTDSRPPITITNVCISLTCSFPSILSAQSLSLGWWQHYGAAKLQWYNNQGFKKKIMFPPKHNKK